MTIEFPGFVLRKPRMASTNSPTTGEGDVVVRQVDRASYLAAYPYNANAISTDYLIEVANNADLFVPTEIIETATFVGEWTYQFNVQGKALESVIDVTPVPDFIYPEAGVLIYNSAPISTPVVTWEPQSLRINWVRNDARTRFGFDDRKNRWTTLPGSSPEFIGKLEETLNLPVSEGVEPVLVVGSKDLSVGTLIPVSVRVGNTAFQDYVDTLVPVPPGEAVMNTDTGDLLFAPDVVNNFLAQDVFFYRENFFPYTKSTGYIGDTEDALFLNPLPLSTEIPLIRVGHGSYLQGQFSNVLTTPPPGFDFVWSDSGHLYMGASFDGRVYYDGVLNATNIAPIAPSSLGTIEAASPFITSGISPVDFTQYEVPYLFVNGHVIRDTPIVTSVKASNKLPITRADIEETTGNVQLSYAFRLRFEGESLFVGCGDFPIEEGITFRMKPSPSDPTNERGTSDGKATVRIVDEILSDSLTAGASFRLPQIPLEDIAGYDDHKFFKVTTGVRSRILEPDVDVIYDFDNRQLLWAEQITHTELIRKDVTEIALPHQVLHNKGYAFDLNEGSGYTPMVEGEDLLIDFGAGRLTPIEVFGKTAVVDIGTLSGVSTLTSATKNLSGTTLPALLVIGTDAYHIVSVTPTTVTVDRAIDIPGTVTEFEIREGFATVYKNGVEPLDLAARTVYPYLVSDISTFAPDAEELEFVLNGIVVPHVMVEPEVLGSLGSPLSIPTHYAIPEALFDIWRDSTQLVFTPNPIPNADEYTLSGLDLVFHAQDEIDFAGFEIRFVPLLSDPRATGPIEVLKETRELGIPADKAGAQVRALLDSSQYQVRDRLLFLTDPLFSGSRLFVRYTSNGNIVEENMGFSVLESVGRTGTSTTFSYGTGRDVDTSRPVTSLVNGVPFTAPVTPTNVTIPGQRSNRLVQVQYFALDASGGEQTVSLLNLPDRGDAEWVVGSAQTFRGAHSVQVGDWVWAGSQSFFVTAVTSTVDTTTIEVSPPCVEALLNPTTLVCRTLDAFTSMNWDIDRSGVGAQELKIFGEVTVPDNHVLKVNGDPYYTLTASFSEGITTVQLGSQIMREYTSPAIELSDYPVYAFNTNVLNYTGPGLVTREATLIRFDSQGVGQVIDPSGYTFEGGGRIVLDPVITGSANPSETWFLGYTRLKTLRPVRIGGFPYLPRFRATYTRRINNPWAGATLRASYDFKAPDAFYFRALRMSEYASELFADLEKRASRTTFGPQISSSLSQKIYEKGVTGLIWKGGDLRDRDRGARAILAYYNDVISKFEEILEVVDGRVIGDRDGKFLFRLQGDDLPGGIDPVTGVLIPYYANPNDPGVKPTSSEIQALTLASLKGAIQNHMDDLVLVSPKPFRLTPPFTFELIGTYKQAWEPSKLSRLYPESKDIFTITAPDRDNDSSYEYFEDFSNTLADLKQENVLSVSNVRKRGAKAYVREEGINGGVISIATEYNIQSGVFENVTYTPQSPNPSTYTPAFEVGNFVNMGRVTYVKMGDIVERVEVVYAFNMEVVSVGLDSIEVIQFAGPASGITLTDPSTITPMVGDTIWVVPNVTEKPFYDSPDFFLNASEGELVNATLPEVFRLLIGQNAIDPLTFLDATINFKNTLMTPFRFPALDGGTLDDDGDQKPPYASPLQDSELQRLPVELARNNDVTLVTWPGLVFEAVVDDSMTLSVPTDLTALGVPPELFDLVVIEGVTDMGDSVRFSVSSVTPTEIRLASFRQLDGSVNVALDNLYSSSGERDGFNTSRWNDPLKDFTDFSGVTTGTLEIGASTYVINTYNNGYLEVAGPILEVGPEPYTISAMVTGSIPATLDQINVAGVDFSDAQGNATLTVGGPNNGTYTATGGGTGFLYLNGIPLAPATSVNIGISTFPSLATGTGSVDVAGSTMWTANSVADVHIGMTLVISDTYNAGRYTVTDVRPGPISEIDVLEGFYNILGDSGLAVYPMAWKAGMPRRFSPEVEALRQEAIRLRPTYADNLGAPMDIAPDLTAISGNVSTPLKGRLYELRDLLFESVFLGSADVDAGLSSFTGVNFEAQGVEEGDYVVVEAGINTGFYLVTSVTTSSVEVVETNTYITYSLTNEIGTSLEVWRGSVLSPRSNDLVWYEVINALNTIARINACIRMTQHDPNDLIGMGLWERRGDPSDATLLAHRNLIAGRRDWISVSPDLRDAIEGLLAGVEALYDIRYAWIDYRVNLLNGTLVS